MARVTSGVESRRALAEALHAHVDLRSRKMRRKTTIVLMVVLACMLLLAVAPAVLAKSQPVDASGSWTWVPYGGTGRVLPSGAEFLKGYEIGE